MRHAKLFRAQKCPYMIKSVKLLTPACGNVLTMLYFTCDIYCAWSLWSLRSKYNSAKIWSVTIIRVTIDDNTCLTIFTMDFILPLIGQDFVCSLLDRCSLISLISQFDYLFSLKMRDTASTVKQETMNYELNGSRVTRPRKLDSAKQNFNSEVKVRSEFFKYFVS